MTARQFASLACKLIAVVVLAQTAQQVFLAVGFIATAAAGGPAAPYRLREALLFSIPVVMPVAVGLFLLARADWVANKLVPDGAAPGPAIPPGQSLLPVGLTLAGAVLTDTFVRDLAASVFVVARSHAEFDQWWHDLDWMRAFGSAVGGLAVSVWMTLGSRGIARAIGWARTAGQPTAAEAESTPVSPMGD